MQDDRRRLLMAGSLAGLLQACGGGGSTSNAPAPAPAPSPSPPPVSSGPPAWPFFAGGGQHAAQTQVATQSLARVIWASPVDLVPPYQAGSDLLIHYGSPVISGGNTVLIPVKTTSAGQFRVEARRASDGGLIWSQSTDYVLPGSSWIPAMHIALDSNNRLYAPASGGRLLIREQVDSSGITARSTAFYGDAAYAASPSAYDANVMINTPLTVGSDGTVYFGFIARAGAPGGLQGGIARLSSSGAGSFAAAASLCADATMSQASTNSAPALSADGKTLYVLVSAANTAIQQTGYLLALDAASLALKARRALISPLTGLPAYVADISTSSPVVGPDGDVYIGVLDAALSSHNARGWLLHFDATLQQQKTPGSFGWDDTPSIVPATAVPAYTGSSSYLLLCKYNNYYGIGSGDGQNRLALLDPGAAQTDRVDPLVQSMREVQTVLGVSPDPTAPGGVREWCVNSAVIDVATRSALVNSEDGHLYRWDFRSNSLSENVQLNPGLGQAYTPTIAGPDGVVYSINNSQLHAVGR